MLAARLGAVPTEAGGTTVPEREQRELYERVRFTVIFDPQRVSPQDGFAVAAVIQSFLARALHSDFGVREGKRWLTVDVDGMLASRWDEFIPAMKSLQRLLSERRIFVTAIELGDVDQQSSIPPDHHHSPEIRGLRVPKGLALRDPSALYLALERSGAQFREEWWVLPFEEEVQQHEGEYEVVESVEKLVHLGVRANHHPTEAPPSIEFRVRTARGSSARLRAKHVQGCDAIRRWPRG